MAEDKKLPPAPTSKIVQFSREGSVNFCLCEDGSLWEVEFFLAKGNKWTCVIEPFNGKQYAFQEKNK
ncbi:MAG: hypothetical protein IKZ88_08075 [Neisseriaceae bacterium]|nr:hypothetical protein [Neisseriaceae bacterium]